MTSLFWQSFIRSFSRSFNRHVQHQSQKCKLKRPRIHFFFGERDRVTMWWLLFKMHKDWPWKWLHLPENWSLGPLAGPLPDILRARVKNVTLKGQESTSLGKEFFYCSILWTLFLWACCGKKSWVARTTLFLLANFAFWWTLGVLPPWTP